jgi:hypothetical protein
MSTFSWTLFRKLRIALKQVFRQNGHLFRGGTILRSKRLLFLFVLLALVLSSCHTAEITYQRHLLSFKESDPSLLLVLVPDRLIVSRSYFTGSEISLESRELPASLSRFEPVVAEKLLETLKTFNSRLKIQKAVSSDDLVMEIPRDPREVGVSGYKKARPFTRETRIPKKTWRPEDDLLPTDQSLDDRFFDDLIVSSRGPFNNNGRTIYRVIGAQNIIDDFDVHYLLFVEVTDIEVKIAGDRLDFSLVLYTRLVSLSDGLLIFEYKDIVDCSAPDGLTGPALRGFRNLEEIQKNDFAVFDEPLKTLGRRYGVVIARYIGFISETEFQAEKKKWGAGQN